MEFLLRIDLALPADMPDAQRDRLLAEEHAHALDLRRSGAIKRFWRLPGGTSNVGIWEAADATHLHQLVSGLPLFPWLVVDVTALAAHPLEAGD
jgi:muconolactone D-isomerase